MGEYNDRVEVVNNKLTIYYEQYGSNDRGYSDLFDFLGDVDIIVAPEIGQDVIVMSGDIYFFTHRDEFELENRSSVTLDMYCSLDKYIDKDDEDDLAFLEWYY